MSSSDSPSPRRRPPSLEELSTRGATTLLLPWILGMASASDSSPREVAVFVHQPTRSITLVESSMDLESVLHEVQSRKGQLPASKASIDSLPLIQVAEPGLECSICLTEFEVNGEERVKEMPCRHQFHGDCIDKWLGIHGSCPLCRFVVAAEEEKKEIRERGGWRIHVFFARGRRGSDPGTGLDPNSNADMEVDQDDDYDDEEMLADNDADMENIN